MASGEDEASDLRDPEWKVFSNPDPSLNSRDFKLRVVDPPKEYQHVLEKVVLAERLREVRSLIGFTRIESPGDYTEIGDFPEEQRVPLSRKAPQLGADLRSAGRGRIPAILRKGDQAWLRNDGSRDAEFFEAHRRWQNRRA